MKVLVTGATGFIGNYVINELLRRNIEVVASSKNEAKARLRDWYSKVSYVPFDLHDYSSDDLFSLFLQPDRLIHLAWQGLPDYKSLFHFEENLPAHYRFLKSLAGSGCKDLTITGTCFEYGMHEGELSEETPARPSNPYGLAKFTLLRFLEELQRQQPFDLKWVRLFYMYGNGQNPRSLFSQLERALESNEPVFNMSGGEQVRDFLPVDEVAKNIVAIAMQNKVLGVVNCSSGKPVKVKDFVREFAAKKNKSIEFNLGYYPYPDYEPMSFWGNNTKLQKVLNEQ